MHKTAALCIKAKKEDWKKEMSFRVSERTLMWAGGCALCFSTRYCTELYSVQWALYHAVYSAFSQYTIQCTVQWYAQSSVFSCFDALLYWSSVWTLHWPCNAQYGQEQQLNYNLVPCTWCILGGKGVVLNGADFIPNWPPVSQSGSLVTQTFPGHHWCVTLSVQHS